MQPLPATRPVLLLHGLWLHGVFLWRLKRALEAAGLAVHLFSYPTRRLTVDESAERLARRLAELELKHVNFIGHSLGGLVVHAFLHRDLHYPPCRTVALGTPFSGSRVARRLASSSLTRWMLGVQADSVLTRGVASWPAGHELGVIAGTRALGAGRLICRFGEPNDGTVAVSETRINGGAEYLSLPVTHTEMMVSTRTAGCAGRFLLDGRFTA